MQARSGSPRPPERQAGYIAANGCILCSELAKGFYVTIADGGDSKSNNDRDKWDLMLARMKAAEKRSGRRNAGACILFAFGIACVLTIVRSWNELLASIGALFDPSTEPALRSDSYIAVGSLVVALGGLLSAIGTASSIIRRPHDKWTFHDAASLFSAGAITVGGFLVAVGAWQ